MILSLAALPLFAVLPLVDAVYAPLLLLTLAGGAAVGAGLLVSQFAPQLQEAVVAGLIQPRFAASGSTV